MFVAVGAVANTHGINSEALLKLWVSQGVSALGLRSAKGFGRGPVYTLQV